MAAPTAALDCGSVTPPTRVAFVVWARRLEVKNRTPAANRRVDADTFRGMQLSFWTSLRFPRHPLRSEDWVEIITVSICCQILSVIANSVRLESPLPSCAARRGIAFEAALLIQPRALPAVSD